MRFTLTLFTFGTQGIHFARTGDGRHANGIVRPGETDAKYRAAEIPSDIRGLVPRPERA